MNINPNTGRLDGQIDLNTTNGWFIASATRGPDSQDDTLKKLTTAVVRHLAGCNPEAMYDHLSILDAIRLFYSLPREEKLRVSRVWFAPATHHFRQHIELALKALHQCGVVSADSYYGWLKNTLNPYNHQWEDAPWL